MDKSLWIYVLLLAWKVHVGESCFNSVRRYSKVVNITDEVNFTLHNPTNLSDYDIQVTYSWDVQVPEDEILDGFLYCFEDVDTASIAALSKRSISPFLFPGFFPFRISNQTLPSFDRLADCRHFVNKTFWVTAQNGSYVSCPFPCEEEIGEPCAQSMLCSMLKDKGCNLLNRDTRSVSFEIEFGRKYMFQIYPYTGLSIQNSEVVGSEKVLIFCGHHLVETVGVHRLKAYEFCRSEQNISELSTASSAPSNFRLFRIDDNYDDHKATVVIRWRPPHDVARGKKVTRYFFSVLGQGVADSTEKIVQDHDSYDTYYNVTVTGLLYNQTHQFSVTPIVDRNGALCATGLQCSQYGERAHLSFYIEDVDACAIVAGKNRATYCDEHASCVDVAPNRIYPANCTCHPGYYGNGVLKVWKGGQGCKNFNACLDRTEPDHICHSNAICTDDEPPSESATCSCPKGFFGDGLRDGSGCTETRFVVGIAVGIPLALAVACVLFCSAWRYRRLRKRALDLKISKFVVRNNSNYTSPLVLSNNNTTLDSSQYDSVFGVKWEVEREELTHLEVIGRGNFGVVHKSNWKRNGVETIVATKSLTGAYTTMHKEDFLAEMALLISLGPHPNVLTVLGVCTSSCRVAVSPLLITEHMPYGDLLHFLWNARERTKRQSDPAYDFTEASLYNIGRQVACGMHFLFRSKVIHGDVAARNILVGKNLQCKISDFGLANDVYRYGLIKGATERRVPFKWVSPERMLSGQIPITWRSDVWSFGILLYEMVTLGGAPYPAMDHVTILNSLRLGYRMPRPESCSEYLYGIMLDCWQWEAIKRPTFLKLEEKLSEAGCLGNSAIEASDALDMNQYDAEIGRRDRCPEETMQTSNAKCCTNGAVITNGGVRELHACSQHSIGNGGPSGSDSNSAHEWWTGDLLVRLESDSV